ncbi:hypothetical protein Tco_0775683 [Tanacetum coccineum]
MKVKESLNVTFDESTPPTKLSSLVDDDVVFSIWKAFGGNTHDLGSFREEMDKTADPTPKSLKDYAYRAWRRRRKHKATPS